MKFVIQLSVVKFAHFAIGEPSRFAEQLRLSDRANLVALCPLGHNAIGKAFLLFFCNY